VPHRVTIGDKSLKDGMVEYQHRRDAEATKVAEDDVFKHLMTKVSV
jgi:prolyl-tRNA synthetase